MYCYFCDLYVICLLSIFLSSSNQPKLLSFIPGDFWPPGSCPYCSLSLKFSFSCSSHGCCSNHENEHHKSFSIGSVTYWGPLCCALKSVTHFALKPCLPGLHPTNNEVLWRYRGNLIPRRHGAPLSADLGSRGPWQLYWTCLRLHSSLGLF